MKRALVVADLPFGSYQGSAEQAFHTSVRFMKEAGAHAVKLEGGAEMAPQVELCTQAGIPVMAHIGFTPQSEHNLGGYRVQGRGETGRRLLADALALEAAGAFAVVMEMVPGDVAAEITKTVTIPTIGIGAGVDCDAQVLVWQDMAGLRTGRLPRFVKQYADLHGVLLGAAAGLRRRRGLRHLPGPGAHVLSRATAQAPTPSSTRNHRATATTGRPATATGRRVNHRQARTNSASQASGSTTL